MSSALQEKLNDPKVREAVENEWLGLGDTSLLAVDNPLLNRPQWAVEQPHLYLLDLLRRPEFFGATCRLLLNKTLHPFQLAVLRELWVRPFPMLLATRGGSKSFILGVYALLRALFNQGSKIVIVGAAFRQSKVVWEYAENIWNEAPVLRDLVGPGTKGRPNGPKRDVDNYRLRIGDSVITALPMGNGEKIRGYRASHLLAEEFGSLNVDIFETVVSGFAAVSVSPVERARNEAYRRALARHGIVLPDKGVNTSLASNQTVISGTCGYTFNHFYKYWKRYKAIVESRGDPKKLEELFGGEIEGEFNWKDFSVIRIPWSLLPSGFMDAKTIAKSKLTYNRGVFLREFSACWVGDSDGFFKRSLIEQCVVGKPDSPIRSPSCGEIVFNAVLRGDPNRRYVMAIDPASEQDNFSIVILELWPDHRRIVYCWTITRARHKAKLKKGLVQEHDFYQACAKKIRELLFLFRCERIALDSQGGGVAVMEALANPAEGRPILPVVDEDDPKETDRMVGDHILEVIQFSRADWVSEANHGMRKDFEDKALLFPEFNPAIIGLAIEEDKLLGRVIADPEGGEKLYDTLEDCVMEIEELKDELATIVHTQTGQTMRDHWDTPETKTPGGRKGRLRKDRYSALLMANAVARDYQRGPLSPVYSVYGGFATELVKQKGASRGRNAHQNPEWYEVATQSPKYGAVVRKGGDTGV
jgi:hypothetical protein